MTLNSSNGFETFKKARTYGAPPGLRISNAATSGLININAAATRLMGNATHVLLMFERASGRIALKPTWPEDPNGFKVSRSAVSTTAAVSAKAFITTYGLQLGARYVITEADGMLIASREEVS